ncbi:MAG: SHOCT domain-containing protein [Myxococcota bacterium]
MAVIWLAVIAGLVLLVRWLVLQSRAPVEGPREDSAMDILKQRYARGEIDQEEYQRKKKELESSR